MLRTSLRREALACLTRWLAVVVVTATPTLGQAVWTGAIGDNWDDPSNWNGIAGVPNVGTSVVVPSVVSGNYPASFSSAPACFSLTIGTGASVAIGAGFALSVADSLEVSAAGALVT